MARNIDSDVPRMQSVLHPTDFSEGSRVAFHHALKATLLSKSKLTLLGVNPDQNARGFPGVRETLERWKLLPENSPRAAVAKLGIDARKIVSQYDDPVEAVMHFLDLYPIDLIVLATHQQDGRVSWLGKSVATPVARRASEMTLFIPGQSDGFVSEADGSVSLERILIPIAASPDPQTAIEAVCRLVVDLQCRQGTFTLLHVGESDSMPATMQLGVPGWQWNIERRSGDVIETITRTAGELDADLVVMATDGRSGFLEGLRGSHSERVLRQAAVPLLTVPATISER
jgi:nucleotide-binding universal stress UspA family protein